MDDIDCNKKRNDCTLETVKNPGDSFGASVSVFGEQLHSDSVAIRKRCFRTGEESAGNDKKNYYDNTSWYIVHRKKSLLNLHNDLLLHIIYNFSIVLTQKAMPAEKLPAGITFHYFIND
jgi:hypothetical protein